MHIQLIKIKQRKNNKMKRGYLTFQVTKLYEETIKA